MAHHNLLPPHWRAQLTGVNGEEPCRSVGSGQQQGTQLWPHPGGRPSFKLQRKIEGAPEASVVTPSENFFPDLFPGNQANGSYVAKTQQADTQGTLRPFRVISRSSLCFILEDFPLPRLCVCVWVWAGQRVEYEGVMQGTKHFSVWHVLV